MKKSILFLGLLGGLTSCDKLLDGTPKCDDKEVIALVEELGIPKKDYWLNIYNEYYNEDFRKYPKKDEGYTLTYSQKAFDSWSKIRDDFNKKYGDNWRYKIHGSYYYKPTEKEKEKYQKLKEEEDKLIKQLHKELYEEYEKNMAYIKDNYQTDATLKAIYDSYYSTKTSNIRPISSDKENKKCECEATLTVGNKNEKEIHYTAQRNTDGDIYVELWNF